MAEYCTRCGAALDSGLAYCTSCGAPVDGPQAPAPTSFAPPEAGGLKKMSTATLVIIIFVAVLAVGGIAAGIFFLSGGATGDCVRIFEGTRSEYPNYSEAECDAFCEPLRFGSCFFEPYIAHPT